MGRTLHEWIASLPAAERHRVEARAVELNAEEMSLRDLRKAMKKTRPACRRSTSGRVRRMQREQDGTAHSRLTMIPRPRRPR